MRTDNLDMRHARFCQNIQASNLFSTQKRVFIRSVVFLPKKITLQQAWLFLSKEH